MTQYIGAVPESAKQQVITVDQRKSSDNYIINPTFIVNQRGFAGGALANTVYGFDRWKARGSSITVTVPSSDGYVTIAGAGAGANEGMEQVLEEFEYDGDVTISWEGSSKLRVFRATGGWSNEMTSPAVINLADGSTNNLKEYILFGNGTLRNVKLETGREQTEFEYPSYADEYQRCLRYFERLGSTTAKIAFASGYMWYTTLPIVTTHYSYKRVEPTISYSSVGAIQILCAGNVAVTSTNISSLNTSQQSTSLQVTTPAPAGIAAGEGCQGLIFQSSYIDVSAEF